MTLHPRKNNQGKPVTIEHPHDPSGLDAWKAVDQIATVVPGGPLPAEVNGLLLAPWVDAPRDRNEWIHRGQGAGFEEPPFEPKDMEPAAGAVVLEPDGRVWLVAPTNAYGGYRATFPKGKCKGMDLRATALKEVFEESGLQVVLTAHLVDVTRTASRTRYYLAQRVGGSPAAMGWESQAVHLVPQECLARLATHAKDQTILEALSRFLRSASSAWLEHWIEQHGTTQRVCFAIQGFLATYGRWPTRLILSRDALAQVQRELTPTGFARLGQALRIESDGVHTLAVVDGAQRLFDYDAPDAFQVRWRIPKSAVTTWIWGALPPAN